MNVPGQSRWCSGIVLSLRRIGPVCREDDNSDQDVINDSMDNMVVQDECLDEKILQLKLQ